MCSLREKESLHHYSDTLNSDRQIHFVGGCSNIAHAFREWDGGGGGDTHLSGFLPVRVKEAVIHRRLLLPFHFLRPAFLVLHVKRFSFGQGGYRRGSLCLHGCCVCLPLSPSKKTWWAQHCRWLLPVLQKFFIWKRKRLWFVRDREPKRKD